MVRARKVKKEIKVLKELSRNVREIKRERNGNIEEDESEQSGDRRFENGEGFVSGGERTAPVLRVDNQQASQNLEQVARTAPETARTTAEDTGNQSFYSANYDAKYDNRNYETREQEQIVRPTVRATGSLIEGDFDLRKLRRMPASQVTEQMQAGQDNWVGGIPEERRYQPKDDVLKEQAKQIDKRRRMM